jgi:amino-acid N-acetyltransferase
MKNNEDFVHWFRNSSPYIHAHRNRTFVIFFGGEAVQEDCANLIHDIALLRSLGIRLVLVSGIRPQIDCRLQQQGISSEFKNNLRITDIATLQCVKEAAGTVRVEIEALLSMGLTNSPMAGAKIKVASGNFVTARPLGVIDGIDFCHTGVVRRIDEAGIHQQLNQQNVVLISPLGYSPSGDIFNLAAEDVATEVAIALQAQKLILLTEDSFYAPDSGKILPQMTTDEAKAFLQHYPELAAHHIRTLTAAIASCERGVERVHLINRKQDGALLLELFTRDGIGTLISSAAFETLRSASLDDIGGILELIKPLEQQGKLAKRSREKLETEINDYLVIERDGLIIGCTALHVFKENAAAVMACLAVHPDYQKAARGQRLFEHLINQARQQNLIKLYVLTTQTTHWFIERGFLTANMQTLPDVLKSYYNPQRNSKILYKELTYT